MTTIALENVTRSPREPVILHLEHEVYCAAAGDCGCTRLPVRGSVFDPAQQKKLPQVMNQRFPRAITLNAPGTKGSKLAGLHPSAEKCADVVAAIEAHKIRVTKDAAEQPAAAPASPPKVDPAPDKAPRAARKPVTPAPPPAPDSPPSG